MIKLQFYIIICLFIVLNFSKISAYAFFGAKFEPPDGQIYHGAQAEVRPAGFFQYHVDWNGIEKYSETCGKHPKLIMHYISFDPVAFWLLKSSIVEISKKRYDYIPQIGLDFYSYIPGFNILNPNDITREIAIGEYDHRIKALAQLFIKMEIPVFLRPGYEFGGHGQGRHASKEYWIEAWKRIYSVFKAENVMNVAFVWNTLDAIDFMEYYPGDEYVDWWAVNIFRNNADADPFIDQFIKEAAKHKKPVMIAESTPRYIGSIHGENSWEAWYDPYFKLLFKYNHVKAFCYINASWYKYPDKSFQFDCRIQKNPLIKSKYSEIISDTRFINADKK